MSSKNYNDGLYEIAEAIREHSKSIGNLADCVKLSFMDGQGDNITDKVSMVAEEFAMLNTLIEEAGRLLGIADHKGIREER